MLPLHRWDPWLQWFRLARWVQHCRQRRWLRSDLVFQLRRLGPLVLLPPVGLSLRSGLSLQSGRLHQ